MIIMDLKLPSLHECQVDWSRETVIVRCDLNVPIVYGKIIDSTRIQACIPTLEFLAEKGAKVVVIAHYGQVKNRDKKSDLHHLSLLPMAQALGQLMNRRVLFYGDCIKDCTQKIIHQLDHGSILVLENLRFYPGEENNDVDFAKDLANLGTFYVNDAFSICHRTHASIVGIPIFLPHTGGLSLIKEYNSIRDILFQAKNPLVTLIGGSKVSSKLELLEFVLPKVSKMFIGGAMANTFLKAKKYNIGRSLVEDHLVPKALELLNTYHTKFFLPVDVVVNLQGRCPTHSFCVAIEDVPNEAKIFDIGPQTVALYKQEMNEAQSLIMNGPMGMFEEDIFAKGSIDIIQHIVSRTQDYGLLSMAGGGDTLALLGKASAKEKLSFVSTGGGAFLALLQGEILPGIDALIKTHRF